MNAFDRPRSLAINKARLDHLASLELPLNEKLVLEVGAGIGLLTSFFEERDCLVLSCDGRRGNCRENLRRHPDRIVFHFDLLTGNYGRLPNVDVCVCYGVLYHLSEPAYVVEQLAKLTWELFLVDSCFYPKDDGELYPLDENSKMIDQSLDGYGCRPSRNWLWNELSKHFDYVYCPRTQPLHKEFPLMWPTRTRQNSRAVFVASRKPLGLPTLSKRLLRRYARHTVR